MLRKKTLSQCHSNHAAKNTLPLNHLAWKFGTLNLPGENGRKIHGGSPDLVMEGIPFYKISRSTAEAYLKVNRMQIFLLEA